MHYSSVKRKVFLRDLLYKALIFAGTVAVIVYFLPRDSKFNYQFDINKPWKYGQLIAPFDFPIYKSSDVVKLEQDSILAHFLPYFQRNAEVEEQALKMLRTDYQTRLRDVLPSPSYLAYLEKKLSEVYQTGILSSDEWTQLTRDSTEAVMVVDDKLANQEKTQQLFTVKRAYHYILTADSTHFRPDALRLCPLNDYLNPNLVYDDQRTEAAKKDLLANYSWANGIVLSGQQIIDRGEIVDRQTFNILQSLQRESIKRSDSTGQQRLMLVGQLLFVSFLMLCFMVFLDIFRKEYYNHKNSLTLLFALITLYCVLTSLMISRNFWTVYILPYAMLPIIIRVFLDSRTAFMAHVVTVLICSICLRYPHEFILLQIAAGMVAIFSLQELSQRSQLFRTALFVILSYVLVYFGFEILSETDLSKLNGSMYISFVLNGILLLFAYPLLFLVEKSFGFTSNVTLVELSNINTPLLRRMSETVPGTFQHSMQVANLAAAAANYIGANSQLVRTGALYHDIGKMANPIYFTENQSGSVNPHKDLSYEESARMVISHVTEGLKMADKNNLPKVIKEFISTHHGKGKTKYFYISWMNDHPGEEPDEKLFTYPGPNPFTKEQAILMMADAVEAASRSLSEYTEENISNLVEKIIDSQVAEGFFRECPVTFKDIATVKAVFKEKLKTMYHTRISYPELKTEQHENTSTSPEKGTAIVKASQD